MKNIKQYHLEWQRKNREKVRETNRNYYWENKETLRPTIAIHWARKIMEKFPGTKLEVLNYCGNAKILKD